MTIYNYESDDLYKQVRGDESPQTPVYYSDVIKDVIDGASPNYPKLTDYEKEWLYFNKNNYEPGEPVDLEYVSIENVTRGTFLNSIPYEYKRASLKGYTTVNLSESNGYKTTTFRDTQSYVIDFQTNINRYKPNTKYLVITEFDHDFKYRFGVNIEHVKTIFHENTVITEATGSIFKHILTTKSDFTGCDVTLRTVIYKDPNVADFSVTYRIMIIEYQEGMENWDIPYFVGMQSVQMPVLTTSNEDGTKTNILTVNEYIELRGIGEVKDELNLLTGELTQRFEEVVLDGSESWSQGGTQSSGLVRFYVPPTIKKSQVAKVISPNFPYYNGTINYGVDGTENVTGISYNAHLNVNIRTERIGVTDLTNSKQNIELFKQWLSNNPITVQYEIETELVKTVDLPFRPKPMDGATHLESNALLSFECPIVSTGTQTLNDINGQED